MKLTIGFSPCPNDTFIFDALVNKKIDTGPFEFEAILEDVETLNEWALAGKLEITKLSFPAFFKSMNHYRLLLAGSALGKGVGPLLIKYKEALAGTVEEQLVALPGVNTTANLLFSFAYPSAHKKKFMVFSDIEDAVINGDAALGVIIHENRFTYQDRGLVKIMDLGQHWEEKMHVPIPLGGIAIKKNIGTDVAQKVNDLIQKSVAYSFQHYPAISDYIKQHAQAMDEAVMRKHIELYVNDYTINLGEAGQNAVLELFKTYKGEEEASKNGLQNEIFINGKIL